MVSSKPIAALAGKRILVVEDEILIYMLIESLLDEHACQVLPPAARVATALEAVASNAFDAAILDLNLAGEPVYPVAEALAQRRSPFIFLTGYGEGALDGKFHDRPVVQKPFRDGALLDVLMKLLETSGDGGRGR